MPDDLSPTWPTLDTAGVDGVLVRFSDTLTDASNRATLAFKAAVESADWPEVEEVTMALASTYLRFDIGRISHAEIVSRVETLLGEADWFERPLPSHRRRWTIPCVFGGDAGPQLAFVAEQVGCSVEKAIHDLTQPVRVQALGFAPGQPYLGQLPPAWNIPRQTNLTPQVPAGALTVAIRQFVLFAVSAPTGWHHVGQTGFQPYQPGDPDPFLLRPGDEVRFDPVTVLPSDAPLGGATVIDIA